jgi:hypothetical protein
VVFYIHFSYTPPFCTTHELNEEDKLGVFEKRVLRRTFEPKEEEVSGNWRRLHNEELYQALLA